MTNTEKGKQNVENTKFETGDELLNLKKEVAKYIVDKLQEKNPDFLSMFLEEHITNYITDDGTLMDTIHDELLMGKLGKNIGIITPTLEKYRKMFSEASSKAEVENLKSTILNEIGGSSQSSTSEPGTNETKDESTTSDKETSQKQGQEKEGSKDESTTSDKETSQKQGQEKEGSKDESATSDKETSQNEKESKEVDDKGKTYTNPISGLTYKRIDQVTDPAGKLRYSGKRSGKTVADIGCLLASGCTVTSALCPEVTLKDCFNTVRHRSANDAVEKMSNNKWKAEALLPGQSGNRTKAQEQKAKEEIIENLKKGYPAVIGCRHSGIDGTNSSIVSQHYRAILGIRTKNGENEFFVGNTYRNGGGGWLKERDIFWNMIHASMFTPTQA